MNGESGAQVESLTDRAAASRTKRAALTAELQAEPSEQEALEAMRPELATLSRGALLRVNLNVPTLVSTVLGVLPRLRALRPRLAQLPDFDLKQFDQLETYLLALNASHAEYLAAARRRTELPPLASVARQLRDVLQADVRSLVLRGYVKHQQLSGLSGRRGYLNLVNDLGILVTLLREAEARAAGKWRADASELAQATTLTHQILRLITLRKKPTEARRAAAELRARAFTLFMRTYDETRRAVSYVEWQHPALKTAAPPLRGAPGKKRRKRGKGEEAPLKETLSPPLNLTLEDEQGIEVSVARGQ